MTILKFLIEAIAYIVSNLISLYSIVIFIACVLSYTNPDPYNKFVQIIQRLTEPAFGFIRKMMPTIFGGVDLAPLILWIILMFIDKFIVRILYWLV